MARATTSGPATVEPAAPHIDIEASLLPTLVERLRLGTWLLLVAFAIFLATSLLSGAQEGAAITSIQIVRLALLALCLLVLRVWQTERATLVVGVVAISGVAVSLAVIGVLREDYTSNALVSVAVIIGAATLIPWGPLAQSVVATVAAGSLVIDAWYVTGTLVQGLNPAAAVTLVICAGSSIYIAHDQRRSRLALEARLRAGRDAAERTRAYHALVAAVHRAELHFITERNPEEIFNVLLDSLLALTDSRYGFIGDVLHAEDGHTYLKCHVISNLAWNDETRALYEAQAPNLEFHKLDNLFGLVITTRQTVISNDPATDPRRAGFPSGHPNIHAFLGMPLEVGDELVGMVGIANRPGGYDAELVEYLQPFLTSCAHLARAYRNDQLRKQAEAEVRRLNATLERRVEERTAELEAANRDLSRFSYSVSHDLRAPLRAITGFAQVLVDECAGSLDVNARDYLLRVHGAAIRMGALIDDLLTLARLGRGELAAGLVDLAPLARGIMAELARRAPERNVELVLTGDLSVHGDAGLLRVVLENLIGNSWKFTSREPHARIELGCTADGDGRTYFVRDNGIGFDMRFADKLFLAFERLHVGQEFEGTGIGLATVQTIVQRHGGQVWAESVVGEGATFYFTLPEPKAVEV